MSEQNIGMEQSQVIIVHFVGFFQVGCVHSDLCIYIYVGILEMTEVEENKGKNVHQRYIHPYKGHTKFITLLQACFILGNIKL